jgi:2-polyprenyl-3-methyl-5-hydroxy-6-metoxy-1,4-benzoquinol methylase
MNFEIEKRFENINKSKTFGNIVKTFSLDKKLVLDIGCSYGEFLFHFGRGSTGITIVEEEVKYAKNKGLDVIYGNIESDEFTFEKKFDVVFANNIIEHLYSPHGFLIKIKDSLKPGGLLILGVPCIPKIVSLLHLNKFRGSLAVSHINFFTRDTLIKTVEQAGYEIKETRGFRFLSKITDHLLDWIYPHFYVIAMPQKDFKYPEKRLKELKEYE